MYEPEKIYVQNAGGIDAGVAALMQNANKSTAAARHSVLLIQLT